MRNKALKESIRNRIEFLLKMFDCHAIVAWHIGEEFPNISGEFFVTESGIKVILD